MMMFSLRNHKPKKAGTAINDMNENDFKRSASSSLESLLDILCATLGRSTAQKAVITGITAFESFVPAV